MGDVVKFERKTEEEKYEEALLAQYKETHRPKEIDPNQSVALVLNKEKVEMARHLEALIWKLVEFIDWGIDDIHIERGFTPGRTLTAVRMQLIVPDLTLSEPEAKETLYKAMTGCDWVDFGSNDEGEIVVQFFIDDVMEVKL